MPQLPATTKEQVHLIYRTERSVQQPLIWPKKKIAAGVVLLLDAVQKITATVAGAIPIRHYLLPTRLSTACANNVFSLQQKKRSMRMLQR